jgi:serine/threonine protein phosphatase 1
MIIRKDEKYSRVLAIGDIHGCARHLERLLEAIKPTREDLIVTMGDFIDRGSDSKGVIDTLLALHQDPEVNIVSLLGNHDAMMLMCFDDLQECKALYELPGKVKCDSETIDMWWMVGAREPAPLWFGNQAVATLSSYCNPEQLERLKLIETRVRWPKDYQEPLRDLLAEIIPQEHIDFLQLGCADACETDDFIFVHGGLCPDLPLADQPLFALHWKRFDKNCKPHVSGKKVICGHTPQRDLLAHDLGHALCLDTGAYMARGFLTCIDVLSGQCWQIDDDLQLSPQPVVHYDNRVPFIRIAELPAEEQTRFMPCLMGRSAPFDGCAWPHDYREWWWGKR